MHASAARVYAAKRRPRKTYGRFVIRDAADTDLGDLLHLWRELMEVHVESDERFALSEDSDKQFFQYLETARSREDYRVRIASRRGQALGFVICCVLPNSPMYRARWIGYINDISVAKNARGEGVGTALVKDAVRWMCDRGAESVEVYVAKTNSGALGFWRRMGGQDYLERLSLDLSMFHRG